jgi:hypothetical protein
MGAEEHKLIDNRFHSLNFFSPPYPRFPIHPHNLRIKINGGRGIEGIKKMIFLYEMEVKISKVLSTPPILKKVALLVNLSPHKCNNV